MDEKKDLNLLLGMYKNMNKTDEEKVQLMVSEQKLKIELEEVKRQMRRIEVSKVLLLRIFQNLIRNEILFYLFSVGKSIR